ncbi:MAG: hypothetical protein Q7V01_15375 [Vicinamibacterales bacterium]|nr:hypothetical protein [Vicinamibacterales bacterium]
MLARQGRRLQGHGLRVLAAMTMIAWSNAAASSPQGAAPVPSGAALYLKQTDQALDRMDRMMSEATASYTRGDRAKSAEASLQEAREKLQIVESRHGAKMGLSHPELVARRTRIAEGEKKVAAFVANMSAATQADAQARDARDKAETAAREAARAQEAAERSRRTAAAAAAPAAGGSTASGGRVVFSAAPIDPATPANLTTRFNAGDMIYGLVQAPQPWRQIYRAAGKSELGLMVVMEIGSSETLQYVTLKSAADIDSSHLVLDIAPAPDKMTAYRNPNIAFGEGKGNLKIGPIAFTHELARLPAGTHTVKIYIRNFGDKPAAGQFEIAGANFGAYAALHEKVKAAAQSISTLPTAGMVNKDLEGQMRRLLANAGWTSILRVVIVDKDWWVEAGTRRYLNVAAAAKAADGSAYWHNLQFSQHRLISGGWGPLELTQTGVRRSIPLANVNK